MVEQDLAKVGVPKYLVKSAVIDHIGTTDVDLALDRLICVRAPGGGKPQVGGGLKKRGTKQEDWRERSSRVSICGLGERRSRCECCSCDRLRLAGKWNWEFVQLPLTCDVLRATRAQAQGRISARTMDWFERLFVAVNVLVKARRMA